MILCVHTASPYSYMCLDISYNASQMPHSSRIDLWSEEGECLVILPTSRYCGPGGVTYRFTSEKVAVFKYSDHSSYSELHQFVKAVRPKKIIPIVQFRGVSASRNNVDVFRSYLSTDSLVCVIHVYTCIYCVCVVHTNMCMYCTYVCVWHIRTNTCICIYCTYVCGTYKHMYVLYLCVWHIQTCVCTACICVVHTCMYCMIDMVVSWHRQRMH